MPHAVKMSLALFILKQLLTDTRDTGKLLLVSPRSEMNYTREVSQLASKLNKHQYQEHCLMSHFFVSQNIFFFISMISF